MAMLCSLLNLPEYEKITVHKGHTYRLRFINAASHTDSFWLSIDHHQMTVIELDGLLTKEYNNVTELHMATGQRYSVLLRATRNVDNYWLRIRDREGVVGRAVIHYDGAADVEPTTKPMNNGVQTNWLTRYQTDFGGRWIPPRAPTMNMTLNISLIRDPAGLSPPRWAFNDVVFHHPSRPVLQSFFEEKPYETNVLEVGMFEVIYMAVNNLEFLPHPFHIHGHLFYEVCLRKPPLFLEGAWHWHSGSQPDR